MSYAPILAILDGLTTNPSVKQYTVLKYEHSVSTFHLKLRIDFTDQSILFTNEYLGNAIRKYASHWQRADQTELIRWDNAPHFPQLISFPHHRHDYRQGTEVVTDSFDIPLTEVLTYISQQLISPNP